MSTHPRLPRRVSVGAIPFLARAKDAAQLFLAIKTKLEQQAGYVVWRQDVAVPSQQDPRLRGQRAGISEQRPPLPAADPGAVIVHRWRERQAGV